MESQGAVQALSALAQETRLAAFRLLAAAGPDGAAAGDIARRLGVPANTMSAHLAVLARAGLVASRRDGRSIIYVADMPGIRALLGFLLRDCCGGHPEVCAPLLDIAGLGACASPSPTSTGRVRANP